MNPPVSVVCTVKNEGDNILNLLESLKNQTRKPDEVIIVDGGSTDNTPSIIKEFSQNNQIFKLIIKEGSNIAQGRNLAIKSSRNELMAVTDAGCLPKEDWLENLLKEMNEDTDVVSGFYLPDMRSKFEEMVANLTYPKLELIDEKNFLPSSRSVCFRKKCWEEIGGYPEESLTAEDTFFDIKLKEKNFKFRFAKDAIVYWRCRKNFKQLFKQWYGYAKGDGILGLIKKEGYGKKHYRKIILEGYGFTLSIFLGISISFLIPLIFATLGLGYFYLIFLRKTLKIKQKTFSMEDNLRGILILMTIHVGQFFGIHIGYIKHKSLH